MREINWSVQSIVGATAIIRSNCWFPLEFSCLGVDASKLDGPPRATILDAPYEGREVVLEFTITAMAMR